MERCGRNHYARGTIPNPNNSISIIFSSITAEKFFIRSFQVTHWQSPHMHAYFPALNSFPSLLGDMLADAINCLGFTWVGNVILKLFFKILNVYFFVVYHRFTYTEA